MAKACKYCGSDRHGSTFCLFAPRKPILKTKKLLNRVGKVAAEWIETRHEYIQNHPATDGYWECYLRISPRCIRFMDIDQLTIDHVIPKGRRSDLRRDQDNLRPACGFCNSLKGSNTLEELKTLGIFKED